MQAVSKPDETLALTHKKREGDEPASTVATSTPVPVGTSTDTPGMRSFFSLSNLFVFPSPPPIYLSISVCLSPNSIS